MSDTQTPETENKADGPKTADAVTSEPKIVLTFTKKESTAEPLKITCGPNPVNVIMALGQWKEEHADDFGDYLIQSSEIESQDNSSPMFHVDAVLAKYLSSVVHFDGIRSVISDCLSFLMRNSTLAAASVSLSFIDPSKGPVGVSISAKNTYLDNAEAVNACVDICIQAAAKAVAKHQSSKKPGIVVPDREIVVPGQTPPKGGIIVP